LAVQELHRSVERAGGDVISSQRREEEVSGWDMGDDVNVEEEVDFVNVESAEAGAGSTSPRRAFSKEE
jgi:hypothetical protein